MSDPYWKSEREWVCPKHLPSVKLPANIEKCFFSGCSSVRPSNRPGNSSVVSSSSIVSSSKVRKRNSTKPAKTTAGEESLCSWFKCEKGEDGGRATVRSNSKYCSRDCSNRNARWRHKQRKR